MRGLQQDWQQGERAAGTGMKREKQMVTQEVPVAAVTAAAAAAAVAAAVTGLAAVLALLETVQAWESQAAAPGRRPAPLEVVLLQHIAALTAYPATPRTVCESM